MKKITMADVATKLAGANLTATNGVLAAAGGGGGGGGIFTEINATQAATTSSVSVGKSGAPNGILEVSGSQETSGTPLFRVTGDYPGGVTAAGPPEPIFFVTGSGNVGIGTSSPSRALEISGSNNAYMKFEAENYRGYTMGSEAYGFIIFDDNTGGTPGYRFVISDTADRLGYVGIGSGLTAPSAQLHVSSSGDISNYGVLRVDGDAHANILFVTGSNRVGIGTNAPTAMLHVSGTVADAKLLVASDSKAIELFPASGPAMGFGTPADTDYYMKFGAFGGLNQLWLNNGTTDFQISGSVGGVGYYLDQSEGHVGIGTTTPTAQLAVNGALDVTGSIMPGDDNTHDLGSSAMRWANVYTGDLHLANDRGNWTVVEESDYLTIRNNKTGKRFKLLMEEID
jgi:hypothetical protein